MIDETTQSIWNIKFSRIHENRYNYICIFIYANSQFYDLNDLLNCDNLNNVEYNGIKFPNEKCTICFYIILFSWQKWIIYLNFWQFFIF
jgi:hypothetical protein